MANLKGSPMAASMAVQLMQDQFDYPDEPAEYRPGLRDRLLETVSKLRFNIKWSAAMCRLWIIANKKNVVARLLKYPG